MLAAILAGMHHGITQALRPTPEARGSTHDGDALPLARTFFAALDRFADGEILRGYFPPRYPELFREAKLGEFADLFATPVAREYDYYL